MGKEYIHLNINRLITFMVCLFITVSAFAQSHAPNKGDVIFFYPVADNLRKNISGYDCFYSTEKAYKNGKFKIKPQFRFKAGADGLTPLEEIEGHKFTVLSSVKENADAKKVEKKAYVCFLQRDDGEKLFLRVPYVRQEQDNALTHGMTLYFTNNQNVPIYRINIPCVLEKEYNDDAKYLSGKEITKYIRSQLDLSKKEDILKKQASFLGGYVPKSLFLSGFDMLCDSVAFYNVDSYSFKQPIAFCKKDDRFIKLPLYDLRGAGNAVYGDGFRLTDFFERKEDLFNHLLKSANFKTNIYTLIGKRVRYDGTGYFTQLDKSQEKEVIYLDGHGLYKLKAGSNYKFEKFDKREDGLTIVAIMSDSIGTKFEIPYRYIDHYISTDDVRDRKFELEEHYLARITKDKKEREASAKEYDVNYRKYLAKYKDDDVASSLAQGYYTEDELIRYRKKYGIKKAKLILSHEYRIGWTVEEVNEAIGYDYFDRINTYEDKYSYYEMYQYRKNNPKYFLFKNGKLVSVSD